MHADAKKEEDHDAEQKQATIEQETVTAGRGNTEKLHRGTAVRSAVESANGDKQYSVTHLSNCIELLAKQ